MRPPCCEICDVEFDPTSGGDLLRFTPDPDPDPGTDPARTHAVGHDPDQGWFCSSHVDAARSLVDHPLELVVARILTGEPTLVLGPRHRGLPRLRSVPCVTIEAGRLHRELVDWAPLILAELGIVDAPALTAESTRSWTPMDGVEPPWCPYSRHLRTHGTDDHHRVVISHTANHWNDDEVANASTSFGVWSVPDDGLLAHVSGSANGSGTRSVSIDHLHIGPRDSDAQHALLRTALDIVGRA